MTEEPGVYVLNKIPEAGNFEYIYKNKKVVLKKDQYGPSFVQMDPPSGMFIIQRKERETFSPIKYYFNDGRKVVHNFDIFQARKFEIRFLPERCEYELEFGNVRSLTTIMLDTDKEIIYISLKLTSKNDEDIKVLSTASFDPIDTGMAVWDKKEWYSVTEADGLNNPLFVTRHYSVNGNKDDRRNILFLTNKDVLSIRNSPERLRFFTKNYTTLPESVSNKELEALVCYEQIVALRFDIRSGETINSLIKITDDSVNINKNELLERFNVSNLNEIRNKAKESYEGLISRRKIETPDKEFNNFVNNYLPLELSWVTDLDRGWPTGMRGSRDCANDFLGYLAYDLGKCKEIIKSLFDNERYEDGWFPRQIPSNGSKKYDLRPFSDSGAFVIELIYEYLSYSNDFGLLDEMFTYYNSDKIGTGLEHLIKAAKYYTLDENIGEHSLIKLHGGDWLDCLNRVGLKGRG